MRIIPKKTKVKIEFFKGVELPDVLVGMVGAFIAVTLFVSNVPYNLILGAVAVLIFGTLIFPFDDEKVYMMAFSTIKYFARHRKFKRREQPSEPSVPPSKVATPEPEDEPEEIVVSKKGRSKKHKKAKTKQTANSKQAGKAKPAKSKAAGRKARNTGGGVPDVKGITPFTGIDDSFIEYGGKYYGVVIEVPSIEFKFMTERAQNNLIDRVLGSVLRTVSGQQTALMVKLDRPIIYDDFIQTEYGKIDAIKESYANGLLSDDEITRRIAIIYDRMALTNDLNMRNRVYRPYHYLVFFDKSKTTLREQARSAKQLLDGNDMPCTILDDKQLAVFLKYNYTIAFDEREIERIPKEKYLDWILPQRVDFTSRTVKYDDVVTHNLKIIDYPMLVTNAWGYQLFNIPSTRVVLKMKPVERHNSIRRIDRAIDELRNQGESTGKASKIIEISNHLETLRELLTLLQGDNETLFDVNIYVTVYDYELSDRLKNPQKYTDTAASPIAFKRQIKRQLAEGGFKTTDLYLQQFEAYASSHISAFDMMTSRSRGIHSGSVAAVFPYVYSALSDDGGINIGRSEGRPVFINFFKRDRERINSNMVIIGKSGSGKSYATKTILSNLAAEDSKIFILDPENEYVALAQNLAGKMIDVGSATQGRLNPFHIITNIGDDESDDEESAARTSFNTHMQFLEEFFRQILQGIDPDALEFLNNIVVRMYDEKGINADTDLSALAAADFPVFDDLYEKILAEFQFSTGEYSKNNLRMLLNYISKFSTGGRNAALWNGEATLSTNENFIVFNFQSMLANKNNTLANAQMLLVLKWLDNEIIKNRDYNLKYKANRRIIIVIDEAHVFIDPKFPIALDFMYQLAKRIRKYNGMQIIITQNIKDFVGTEEIARKSTAIINACQYSFIFPLAPNDMHDLCKLYEKAGAINEVEQEQIIGNGRGRAFAVTSPTVRTCIEIVATDEVQALFHM